MDRVETLLWALLIVVPLSAIPVLGTLYSPTPATENSPAMIVKIQRSIVSSDPVGTVLIYNAARDVVRQVPMDDTLAKLFKSDEMKHFRKATLSATTDTFSFGARVKDPGW